MKAAVRFGLTLALLCGCSEAPAPSALPIDSAGTVVDAVAGVSSQTSDSGDGGVAAAGSAFWHFDDCSPRSPNLVDSSGGGADARHALHASCVEGISGLGVAIHGPRDQIRVPARPGLGGAERIAVAAWIRADHLDGDQPIIGRGSGSAASFSLALRNGNLEMSVYLEGGAVAVASASLATNAFTHVAGMYDGTSVSLLLNGSEVARVQGAGMIRRSSVPIWMGAAAGRHFDGVLDEVFLSTQAIDADTLVALACIRRPFAHSLRFRPGGPVPVGTTLHYDITVVDRDVGTCPASFYSLTLANADPGVTVSFQPFGQNASAGATLAFGMDVTGVADADPGLHDLLVDIDKVSLGVFEEQFARAPYDIAPPADCFVSKRSELMITTTTVVDDPVRTEGDGPFSFGHLLRQIAPTEDEASALVERLLSLWLTDQTVNGFVVRARPAMQNQVLDIWPRASSGALDLDRAPLRLQAIVNRVDLRDLGRHSAGEGRFVFAFEIPSPFTVILEYNLPAETQADVLQWAEGWHALSSHVFGSEDYRAALAALTRRFTHRNAWAAGVNGSALLRLRTNEVALTPPMDSRWELRQFELSPSSGMLEEAPVAETPDNGFNGSATFADFVNQNEAAILAAVPGSSTGIVPAIFEGSPFLGGSSLNDFPRGTAWDAPGIVNPVARFRASINTCNGCHGFDTRSIFLQITPRKPGFEARLSSFILGVTVQGPGGPFVLNDLGRRKTDLFGLVCP